MGPKGGPRDYRVISTWWSDKWVENHFLISAQIDPDKPVLVIQGEMPLIDDHPTLHVVSANRNFATIKVDKPGVFTCRIPLTSLLKGQSGRYFPLKFISNTSFNPKKLGQSTDSRDLSWRLYELKLVR